MRDKKELVARQQSSWMGRELKPGELVVVAQQMTWEALGWKLGMREPEST